MSNHHCPKCGSPSARYVKEGPDVWERCLCGLMKLVHTELEEGITVTNVTTTSRTLSLPNPGTQLSKVLATMRVLGIAKTGELKDALFDRGIELTIDQIGNILSYLRYRGLIESVEQGRGRLGGGTWGLSTQYRQLLEKGK